MVCQMYVQASTDEWGANQGRRIAHPPKQRQSGKVEVQCENIAVTSTYVRYEGTVGGQPGEHGSDHARIKKLCRVRDAFLFVSGNPDAIDGLRSLEGIHEVNGSPVGRPRGIQNKRGLRQLRPTALRKIVEHHRMAIVSGSRDIAALGRPSWITNLIRTRQLGELARLQV